MPTENLPWSNLDRLNRHVGVKRYAEGGRVDGERQTKPNLLFPMPLPHPYGPLWKQMSNPFVPFRRM